MSNKKRLRKKLFVDPKVQGTLIARVVLYWGFCLLTISLMLLCWQIATGPARPFVVHLEDMRRHFGPALVASLVLLPLVIVDIVRLSNRFAGPVLRLRRSMRALAEGEPVEPIRFRDGDFLQELAGEFNAVVRRVEQMAAEQSEQEEELEPIGVGD